MAINMERIVEIAREMHCSDIHLSVGLPPTFRIAGSLQQAPFSLTDAETENLINTMMTETQRRQLEQGFDQDFAFASAQNSRQRVNVYRQQGKLATAIRLLNLHIPRLEELGLPPILQTLAEEPRGLILVTGPTGSGKSTTLAAMIENINCKRAEHILTIEDPIEYIYEQKMAIIHQREVGRDVQSFAAALRSALREDPDVILVGEMRDFETISAAVTAAETGHLVLSTLHTSGAAQTIDRIIDACPASTQGQIRIQLSTILRGVVTQQLIPLADGSGRIVASEILIGTDAVGNMIRENKCHQLDSQMQAGAASGMHTLNGDLVRLLSAKKITKENALKFASNKRDLQQYLN